MQIAAAVLRVQAAYPRIYLACHSRHQHARSTPHRLSQRDAAILAHLDDAEAVGQSELARHLGLAKSTLSEALAHLEECRYIVREPAAQRPRTTLVRRTAEGTAAMSGSSVLEAARLERVLRRLTPADRLKAIEGLELLAHAARETSK